MAPDNPVMVLLRAALLFALTACAEIVSCYLPYLWLKAGKSAWLLLPSAAIMAITEALLLAAPIQSVRPGYIRGTSECANITTLGRFCVLVCLLNNTRRLEGRCILEWQVHRAGGMATYSVSVGQENGDCSKALSIFVTEINSAANYWPSQFQLLGLKLNKLQPYLHLYFSL